MRIAIGIVLGLLALSPVQGLAQEPTPPPTPLTPGEWVKSGNAKIDAGDPDGAVKDFTKAIELDPKHAFAWNGRAIARERKGDLDGALADLTKAIELDANLAPFYRNRASVKRAKGDLRGAVTDLSRAIHIFPAYAEAYAARGSAKFALDDLEGSLKDFRTAIQLDPRNPEVYRGMAYAKKDEGDYNGALSDITKAINLAPETAALHASRGLIRSCRGEHADALRDYARAIELKPGDMSLYYFRGCVLADDGKWREALFDFIKAAELSSPTWEFPRLRIWLARARTGERDAATLELHVWLSQRKAPPDDPGTRIATFLTGGLGEAELFRQVDADKSPSARSRRCQAYYMAGQKRLINGERSGARAMFEKAVATEARNWRDYGSAAAELKLLGKK